LTIVPVEARWPLNGGRSLKAAGIVALAALLSCVDRDQLRLRDAERAKQALASLQEGSRRFEAGRYDDACAIYQRALDALPDRSRAEAMAQLLGLENGQAYVAILASIEGNLGLAHLRARRFEEGERHLFIAVQIAPRRARTRANHGIALLRARRPAEAQAELARAIAMGDRRAATFLDLGRAAHQAGDVAAARGALEQAVLRASGRTVDQWGTRLEAQKALAEVDLEVNDLASAERRLKRVLAVVPAEVEARFLLARTIARGGRTEEAELERRIFERDSERLAGIQRLLVESPGNVEALHWVADTYSTLGLHHFAETHYRQLLARNPEDRAARRALMKLSEAIGGGEHEN
jgi:tetratricopeptide (TPR) repeat protein